MSRPVFIRKTAEISQFFRSLSASGSRGLGPFSGCDTIRRAGRYCLGPGERHHPSTHDGDHRRSGSLCGRSLGRCVHVTSGGKPSKCAMVQRGKTSLRVSMEALRSEYQWSEVSFRCTSNVTFRPPQSDIKKDVNPLGCTSRNHDYGKCSIWSKRSSGNCPVRNFSAMMQQAVR